MKILIVTKSAIIKSRIKFNIFTFNNFSNFDLNIFNISFDKYGITLHDILWFIPIIRQSMKS